MNEGIDIIEKVRLISTFSPSIPLLFYLRGLRQSPLQNHFIGCLIIFSISIDLITFLRIVYHPIIHSVYNLVEFTLITLFYYELMYKNRSKQIIFVAIAIYLAVLSYSMTEYGLNRFYSGLISTSSLILISHTLTYTFSTSQMTVERYFDKNFYSNMIFNASIFGYFLILFSLTFLRDQVLLLRDENVFRAFWSVHNVFNILKNLGFAFAFYYTGKREIYMSLEHLERIAKKRDQQTALQQKRTHDQ
jgi:hypothetical protein